jgi:hypothetical protein
MIMTETFVIVKYAGYSWDHYFDKDPKINGVCIQASCANTYSGKLCDIEYSYTDKKKAEEDCDKINKANPCAYYGVCKVIEPV